MRAILADITTLDVDAIVNAANERLARGGGVCGAIFDAAGPELGPACRRIGGCPTGQAVSTPGFNLKARRIVHAVGPVWHGGERNEDTVLAATYAAALEEVRVYGGRSVAFPAISTGIFGYPPDRATAIAVATCRRLGEGLDITFACFSPEMLMIYEAELARPPV